MQNAIIYGCGQQGRDNYEYLKEHFQILAYSDSNNKLWGGKINGLTIIPPDKIASLLKKDGIVVISFANRYGDIMRWCESQDIEYVLCLNNYLYDEEHAISITESGSGFSHTRMQLISDAVQIDQEYSFENVLHMLESKAPYAYKKWYSLVERMRQVTLDQPLHNMSFKGSPVAYAFKQFLAKHLRGVVLDIGCGINNKPSYLGDYPDNLIYGIDPLPPLPGKEHTFVFRKGVCECLPFAENSFDAIIMATSFDHILFLKESMQEISRVLKNGGLLIAWEAFVSKPFYYDPYSGDINPYDADHLFHLTKEAYEGIMMAYGFSKIDHTTASQKQTPKLEEVNHFYALHIHK